MHNYTSITQEEEKSLRTEIVDHSKDYLGIPYKYAGSTPQEGFDCSGFITYIFDKVDIIIEGSAAQMATLGLPREKQNAKVGDLVFFGDNGVNSKLVNHVGLVTAITDKGIEMTHSSSSMGISKVIIDQSSYWKPRLLFFRNVL